MTRSSHWSKRACRVSPGGVHSPVRAMRAVGGTPLFVQRARGAYLHDADGRKLIDMCGSWGPLILGHADPAVVKAVQKEIWNLPVEPELKVKLTEKTGEIEFRIVEGSDPFIQLQALLASFVLAGLAK